MRWLSVTGDDFGITRGISRGIVEANLNGILTNTSLMVDRQACEEAVALARQCPALSLGIHLELEGVEPERVPAELDRQLGRFVALVGAAPTHADSHHDVHYDPRFRPHVMEWARRHGVRVRGLSGVAHFRKFYGQWGGETHLEQIGVEGLLRLVDAGLGEGVTELSCHPGYADHDLPSSYLAEREVELRTLCDPRVRPALQEMGIRLVGFRDLPAFAAPAPGTEEVT